MRILLAVLCLVSMSGCAVFSTVNDQWFFAGDPAQADWPGAPAVSAPRWIDLADPVSIPYKRMASAREATVPAGRLTHCGYDKHGDYYCARQPLSIGGDSKAGGLYVPYGTAAATGVFWHVSFREMEYSRQCLRAVIEPALPVTIVTGDSPSVAPPPGPSSGS